MAGADGADVGGVELEDRFTFDDESLMGVEPLRFDEDDDVDDVERVEVDDEEESSDGGVSEWCNWLTTAARAMGWYGLSKEDKLALL